MGLLVTQQCASLCMGQSEGSEDCFGLDYPVN